MTLIALLTAAAQQAAPNAATLPGAPTNFVAFPSTNEVSLTWTAPADDGGAEIVGYLIEHRRTQ